MAANNQALDLFDIAVLLNYERAVSEPRLRHTKLREVAFPGSKPTSIGSPDSISKGWNNNARTWILLDHQRGDPSEPDLPSNMPQTTEKAKELLKDVSEQQVETLFHQARNHDGCYQAVGLLQIFFNLFPPNTMLQIRHAPRGKGEPGAQYVTNINRRVIIEETLINPKFSTTVVVVNTGIITVSGNEPEMVHAVVGFSPLDSENVVSFLDLSSMQFGDVGRGPGKKGKQMFALDTVPEFEARMNKIAGGQDPSKSKQSAAISGTPMDDWLTEVALRAKKRWDNRATERWCSHCGSPDATFRCSGCRQQWYCGKDHQDMAWKFHRGYCLQGQAGVAAH